MLKPINPGQTFEVTSAHDPAKKDADKTVFVCRIFPARLNAHLADQAGGLDIQADAKGKPVVKQSVTDFNKRALEVFRLGVVELKNWDGKFEQKKKDVAGAQMLKLTEATANQFPFAVIKEIADRISAENRLPEEVLGN